MSEDGTERPSRCSDPITERGGVVGRGAVLYDTRDPHARPCCARSEGRCLAHVLGVFEETTTGTVYFKVADGTWTTEEWIHADDLLAIFEPAGWSVTGVKPTYLLTREHGVADHHDVMTDGGTVEDDTERVMVDIETVGIEPGSALLSIGAVRFSPDGLDDEFYREITLESCQEAGLEIDANTLKWWLSQDGAVTGVLTGGESLTEVLTQFGSWYQAHDFDEIWANSPSFDCEQLETAFQAVGLSEPWEFRDERDVRTLRSLQCAAEVEMNGDEHDALDDAKYQARIVSETLRSLQAGDKQSGGGEQKDV